MPENNYYNSNNNNYLVQIGCRPVAVVKYLVTTTRVGRATCETYSVNLESWDPSQHFLLDTADLRKICAKFGGPRTYEILPKYIL
jgi:hypothetical protein